VISWNFLFVRFLLSLLHFWKLLISSCGWYNVNQFKAALNFHVSFLSTSTLMLSLHHPRPFTFQTSLYSSYITNIHSLSFFCHIKTYLFIHAYFDCAPWSLNFPLVVFNSYVFKIAHTPLVNYEPLEMSNVL